MKNCSPTEKFRRTAALLKKLGMDSCPHSEHTGMKASMDHFFPDKGAPGANGKKYKTSFCMSWIKSQYRDMWSEGEQDDDQGGKDDESASTPGATFVPSSAAATTASDGLGDTVSEVEYLRKEVIFLRSIIRAMKETISKLKVVGERVTTNSGRSDEDWDTVIDCTYTGDYAKTWDRREARDASDTEVEPDDSDTEVEPDD